MTSLGQYFYFRQIITKFDSGDAHGDFHTLVYKMCIRYQMTDTLLIVAGDCGFGFDKLVQCESMPCAQYPRQGVFAQAVELSADEKRLLWDKFLENRF